MEVLLKRRSVTKGLLTRMEKYAATLSDSSCVDEVKERIGRTKELLEQFSSIEDQIFSVKFDEKSEREEFEEQYYRVIAKLNKWLRLQLLSSNNQLNDSNLNSSHINNSEFKLPRVNIPSFSGDYREWQGFFDLFNKMVHENQLLSAAQKFQYLKGVLKGEAFNLLKHLTVTESNYIEAFPKLCKRYDRKSLTANSFIKLFMDQPPIRNANSIAIRRLLDTSDEATRGLKALGTLAECKDPWLLYILFNKLDDESKQLWMRHTVDEDFPALQTFYNFLSNRADELEGIIVSNKGQSLRSTSSAIVKGFHLKPDVTCPVCRTSDHQLFECIEFKAMSVPLRRDLIKTSRRCFNCLNDNHAVYNCRSNKKCRICYKKHHSLLHVTTSSSEIIPSVTTSATGILNQQLNEDLSMESQSAIISPINNQPQCSNTTSLNVNLSQNPKLINQALLPTAMIQIKDGFGEWKLCRALLDSGSQASFVSEDLVQRLQLKRTNGRISIMGIGQSKVGMTKGKVNIHISSSIEDTNWQLECLIISKVTSFQPAAYIEKPNFLHLKDLPLADPTFNKPTKIDVLLGINLFFELLKPGFIKLNDEGLIAQNTVFGWIIAGSSYTNKQGLSSLYSHHCEVNVDHLLQKFWELEEITPSNKISTFSEEEQSCEDHFLKETCRINNGKFMVKLPFKSSNPLNLGDTKRGAFKRLEAMETRFGKDANFKGHYHEFMQTYLSQNNMEEVPPDEINKQEGVYYLPHHGVLKESSSTTKLRVVYDASFKSSNGVSLNDLLMVGPTTYESLISILLRFRLYKIVFIADIEKMFRQIVLHSDDRDYHRILWRFDHTKPPTHYRLTTVTYGTASAPYLATKSLQMIGNNLVESDPIIAHKILHDFYVDDFISGCNTEEEAFKIQVTVTEVLKSYGFNLRKWSSNHSPLLDKIAPECKENNIFDIQNDNLFPKILGIQWNHVKDEFQIKVSIEKKSTASKREVLSQSARIFDPMGWLAPAIVNIKILFQSLWLLNLDWDDHLPTNEAELWQNIKSELPELEKIKISRWYRTKDESYELHGFCDASEKAYSAVVYCRCIDEDGMVKVSLISSKTKVAPINQVSIPRLELCAASLLTKLIVTVRESLGLPEVKTILWTDSTIVLGWLSSPPRRWKTFIANRTSNIISKVSRTCWSHIDSQSNPADCASRGMMPSKLVKFDLWWNGPKWLSESQEKWPDQKFIVNERDLSKEERKSKLSVLVAVSNPENEILKHLLTRISSFPKIIRVIAWIYRCYDKAKHNLSNAFQLDLTVDEIQRSQSKIFIWTQHEYFTTEIRAIKLNQEQPKTSKIRSLSPFLDDQKLLRVGGRIENSAAEYETKHPLILPNSDLTKLMIRTLHQKHHHARSSLLISIIRHTYLVINCSKIVKNVVKQCKKCQRYDEKPIYQIMGNLPKDRVTYESAFLKAGIDYAGPLHIKQIYGRSTQRWKAYLAIFVCMATKAVHIEVVSSLTTEHFIAALHRFVARRGLCKDIYSDNGSNFIGANKELREISEFLKTNSNNILKFLSSENIKWHFIPSSAPTFGGLWEAAVKSFKYHLKRVMGNTIFTFEELTTIATHIEAVLNPRPICSLSEDQLNPLTPGHFLIGRPMVEVPQLIFADTKISHLSRWHNMQKIMQHFSERWKSEYLTSLHKRYKWQSKGQPIQLNEVVLVRETNLPPTKWLLGKVEKMHPGSDGVVRVVTIKTKAGYLKRPVSKLCKFTIDELNQQIQDGRNVQE